MWTSLDFALSSWGLLLAALVAGWYLLMPDKRVRALAMLPRPASTLPWLGNTLDMMFTERHRIHDWLYEQSEATGFKPWLFTCLGRPPTVVLSSISTFEDVLRNQFDIFIKGNVGRLLAGDFFGDGIFAVDGVKWLHQRKTASNLFSMQMMREIMEKVIVQHTRVVCEILDKAYAKGEQVDFKTLMDLYATDVFVQIGFGVDLGCLQNKQDSEFFHAFTNSASGIQYRIQQPMWLWRFKKLLDIGSERRLRQDLKIVNDKIYSVIEECFALKRDGKTELLQKDLVSLFLTKDADEFEDENDRVQVTPQLIRDMALNFIAAGRGTTAVTLDWFIIMMNRYPEVQKKIQEELRTKLPELGNGSKVAPTLEDIAQLTYLEAAIKENLRLNASAPMCARTCSEDTTLSDGTFLKTGTRVVIPTYATARIKDIWGEDAAEFKPERWIDPETGKLIQFSPYKYLVFLAGPRLCLGIKLAIMELKIALAAMLSKYEFKTTRDPFEITYIPSLSLQVAGDIFVTLEPVASKAPASTTTAAVGAA